MMRRKGPVLELDTILLSGVNPSYSSQSIFDETSSVAWGKELSSLGSSISLECISGMVGNKIEKSSICSI